MNQNLLSVDPALWLITVLATAVLLGTALLVLLLLFWNRFHSLYAAPGASNPNVGKLIKAQALARIDELVTIGERIDGSKVAVTDAYFIQVQIFVHYLNLPTDTEFEGQKYSAIERQLVVEVSDIPSRTQGSKSSGEKLYRVLAALKGLRSGLLATSF